MSKWVRVECASQSIMPRYYDELPPRRQGEKGGRAGKQEELPSVVSNLNDCVRVIRGGWLRISRRVTTRGKVAELVAQDTEPLKMATFTEVIFRKAESFPVSEVALEEATWRAGVHERSVTRSKLKLGNWIP